MPASGAGRPQSRMLDATAEARRLSRQLRRLAPKRVDPGPIIKTERPFYGAKVGDLRRLGRRWAREHGDADASEVIAVCDELVRTGVREEIVLACMILDRQVAARGALEPRQIEAWIEPLDNWETTDQLGMLVVGPWVAASPRRGMRELRRLVDHPSPWGRRLVLVGMRGLAREEGANRYWPHVARLILKLAAEREAAMPKAISWVLRENLRACRAQVADFIEANAEALPAVAVRETRNKLATGSKANVVRKMGPGSG